MCEDFDPIKEMHQSLNKVAQYKTLETHNYQRLDWVFRRKMFSALIHFLLTLFLLRIAWGEKVLLNSPMGDHFGFFFMGVLSFAALCLYIKNMMDLDKLVNKHEQMGKTHTL